MRRSFSLAWAAVGIAVSSAYASQSAIPPSSAVRAVSARDVDTPALTVTSPDGRNAIRLYEAPLRCEVLRDGVRVVEQSRLGLLVNGVHMARDNRVVAVVDRSGTGRVATPVYKKAYVDLARTEKFADFGAWGVGLVARDDGVAYRFELKGTNDTVAIDGERFDLVLPSGAQALVYRTRWFGSEESVPELLPVGRVVTKGAERIYLPLVSMAGGKTVAVTESDVCDYPCLYLTREDAAQGFRTKFSGWPRRVHREDCPGPGKRGRWEVVDEAEPYVVRTSGRRALPWRVFALADGPSGLCESDAVFALARPAAGDFSWVRPGKVAWDWWNAFDNRGDAACTTATYERFIDFASRHGVEYVILDEGWSAELDIWTPNPKVDVPHLVAYAAARRVGLILWMAWAQIVGDEERVAEHFAKAGVKGFKVDFIDRADAQAERFVWAFAEACAKHRMLVDYHGVHRPTGLSRTYPNVLNYEGVHGLEQMKMYKGQDMAFNDVAAFFGRLTAGPMDYTPGAMDNYPAGRYPETDPAKGVDMRVNPGSEGTRCHQLAMLTMYEAPLQMLADSPTKYEKNAECLAFMAATPVVWRATVGLGGAPGAYAACARQAADGSWYAAALNSRSARTVTVGTAFLGAGVWRLELFRDAEDADENPTHYVRETRTVKAGEPLTVSLAPGGGFAARFVPQDGD